MLRRYRVKFLSLILTALITSVCSCDSGKDYDFFISKYYLELEKGTLEIEGEYESTASLKINSDCAWTVHIDGACDWLEISPMSGNGNGTVNFKVTKVNNSSEADNIKVIFSADGGKIAQTLSLTRAAGKSQISTSKTSIEFASVESSQTFDVYCNSKWQISEINDPMIKEITPMSGRGNGTVTVTVNNNSSESPRSVKLKITNTQTSGVVEVDLIQQKYTRTLTVDPTLIEVGSDGGETNFLIVSSDAWSISGLPSSNPWFSLSATNSDVAGMVGRVNVVVESNPTGDERKCTFSIVQAATMLIQDVTIRQAGAPNYLMLLSEDRIQCPAVGSTHVIKIHASAEPAVSTLPDWLTVHKSSSQGNIIYYALDVTENPTLDARSATIEFVGSDLDKRVSVRVEQEASDGRLRLLTESVQLPDTGGEFVAELEVLGQLQIGSLPDWIRLAADDSQQGYRRLTFFAQPNTVRSVRRGAIEFAVGSHHATMQVVQAAYEGKVPDNEDNRPPVIN